jgi:serine/threonine-protein phosphatase 6 regulatory ankyrin repeat subunit B
VKNADGNTALIYASIHGDAQCVKMLTAADASTISHQNQYGHGAVTLACDYGNHDVLALLLEQGAHADSETEAGDTALTLSCMNGHVKIVQLLLDAEESSLDIQHQNHFGHSALTLACDYGCDEVVVLLLKQGAAVNTETTDGNTALILATDHGYTRTVQLLLGAASVEVEHQNRFGHRALSLGCSYGWEEVTALLLEHGANADAVTGAHPGELDAGGDTALMYAAVNGHAPSARQLLLAGASIDHQNNQNENALLSGLKMGKQRKYLVLAPLAASTASGTQLQQPQPAPECIAGRGGVWR